MKEIFDLIAANPLIAVVVIGWVLSALGGLGAKAARKNVEQQKRLAQQQQRAEPTSASPEVRASASPTARSEELVAPEAVTNELRRMMGLKPGDTGRPLVAPAPKRAAAVPVPDVVTRVPPVPQESVGASEFGGDAASSWSQLPFQVNIQPSTPVRPRRTVPRRLLDLSNPAAAFVAIEVLGPPRAIRGWD